jgi:hypothetical protein
MEPRRTLARRRCRRRSRSASFGRSPAGLVISPVDRTTACLTPRSTPTTSLLLPRPGRRDRVRDRDRSERDMPTPGPLPGHPVRLPLRQVPAALEPDPADLRDVDRGPLRVVLADPQHLGADDPESLRPAAFPPGGPVVGAGKEVPPRPVHVPQRLLLHGHRTPGEPRERGTRLGQLPGPHGQVRVGPFRRAHLSRCSKTKPGPTPPSPEGRGLLPRRRHDRTSPRSSPRLKPGASRRACR